MNDGDVPYFDADDPPPLAPGPLVELADRVAIRWPDARRWWEVAGKVAHRPSSYFLGIVHARRHLLCRFDVEKVAFDIHDWAPDTSTSAASVDEALWLLHELLSRPPTLVTAPPDDASLTHRALAEAIRALDPSVSVLWRRVPDARVGHVVVAERGRGQAQVHLCPATGRWGIGGAPHITQAFWADDVHEAARRALELVAAGP